jgi:hypothetical protein
LSFNERCDFHTPYPAYFMSSFNKKWVGAFDRLTFNFWPNPCNAWYNDYRKPKINLLQAAAHFWNNEQLLRNACLKSWIPHTGVSKHFWHPWPVANNIVLCMSKKNKTNVIKPITNIIYKFYNPPTLEKFPFKILNGYFGNVQRKKLNS